LRWKKSFQTSATETSGSTDGRNSRVRQTLEKTRARTSSSAIPSEIAQTGTTVPST
jgi:hypothetical protein